MLQSIAPSHRNARHTVAAPVRPAASDVLSLPAIACPHTYTLSTGPGRLSHFAHWLIEGGVLQEKHLIIQRPTLVNTLAGARHLSPPQNAADVMDACTVAIHDHIAPTMGNSTLFRLHYRDDCGTDLGHSTKENYADLRGICTRGKNPEGEYPTVGTLELHLLSDAPDIHVIGPTLERLEKRMPRLGQTVLETLDDALGYSCRALTPRNGCGWASQAYWMGEENEKERIQEDMMQYEPNDPERPTPETWTGFRRADYDAAFPTWASTGTPQPFTLTELQAIHFDISRGVRLGDRSHRHKDDYEITSATVELMQFMHGKKWCGLHDGGMFEHSLWEVSPYLLRWSDTDPLPQIWDDVMNDHYNGGEGEMGMNAAWAFHDQTTLLCGLNRLRLFLQLTQLCQQLINKL